MLAFFTHILASSVNFTQDIKAKNKLHSIYKLIKQSAKSGYYTCTYAFDENELDIANYCCRKLINLGYICDVLTDYRNPHDRPVLTVRW